MIMYFEEKEMGGSKVRRHTKLDQNVYTRVAKVNGPKIGRLTEHKRNFGTSSFSSRTVHSRR